MHNANRISRLAAVGGVAGALALGAFGLAVSAHENTSPLADPASPTPGATATQTPGATQSQTPGGSSSTSTPSQQSPGVAEVPGGTSGGTGSGSGAAPGGTVPGAGNYVPGSGR